MATVRTLLGYVKGPQGETGATGPQGEAGNDGTSATVNIGTVTTAAPGTPARVTNSGTTRDAVFDFVLPQGQPGTVGEIATYPVNEITSSSADFPTPAVGDTIATLAGKQAKATADAQAGLQAANTDIASLLASITLLTNNLWRSAVRDDYSMGNQLTTEQAQMIASGDFKDLPNGAYWQDGSRKIRICDNRNWYKGRGDTEFVSNHLVIMCDENVLKSDGSTTKYMKDTNTTEGGYAGTKYRATYKAQAKKFFTDFFGTAHIASYRGLICTAVNSTTGRPSNWAWQDCDVELPTENMMFGSPYWGNGGGNGYNGGSFYNQLALFQLKPEYIIARTSGGARENSWEQDVVSASHFAHVNRDGYADAYGASRTNVGCRPFALLI